MEDAPTILVVDDDPNVLRVTCALLAWAHYSTLAASTIDEGNALVCQHRDKIVLVLIDQTISDGNGGNGISAGKWLRAEYPKLAVAVFSGNIEDQRELNGLPFVQKPFTPQTLADEVRAIISRREAA